MACTERESSIVCPHAAIGRAGVREEEAQLCGTSSVIVGTNDGSTTTAVHSPQPGLELSLRRDRRRVSEPQSVSEKAASDDRVGASAPRIKPPAEGVEAACEKAAAVL